MNILILGSGGREHAIGWKAKQSKKTKKLYFAPGNAGTATLGKNLNIGVNDFVKIQNAILENNISLLIIGPEVPLAEGLRDFLEEGLKFKNLMIVGPGKAGSQLEGSKDFAKNFMSRYKIPTAKYFTVTEKNIYEGFQFLKSLNPPYVLKADGLAAGKGVLILNELPEAEKMLNKMLEGKFGKASSKVVIEEFLDGIEVSVFIITDGKNYKLLPEAKDYKRVGEGNTGLNTGGMGAISPVPFVNDEFKEKIETKIIKPTIDGLIAENIDYKGFIFFGLINVQGEPFLIEYNVRLGDPEAEAILPRIKSDFIDLLTGAATGTLSDKNIETEKLISATVMLVSKGYPGNYEKGKVITGLEKISGSVVFHAGTKADGQQIITDGGRVLAVNSLGHKIDSALKLAYRNAEIINFENKYYRKDLGFDL